LVGLSSLRAGKGLDGAWDAFLVEYAQSCRSCRSLKAFNCCKKVKALPSVRDTLVSLALVVLDLQAGPFREVGM